jgi:hypothetical protein
MNKFEFPETTKWVVVHNNEDIFQALIVEPNTGLQTGQPYIEVFDSAENAITAFPQLSTDFLNLSAQSFGLPIDLPSPPPPINSIIEPTFEILPPEIT